MTNRTHIADFIVAWNRGQSQKYSSPGAQLEREKYLGKHPTRIIKTLCMDGRINLATMTQTPPGIMYPFRTMGGKFDMGYPYYSEVVHDLVQDAVHHGHDVLKLCTYHFSEGDNPHRGCKGMAYDIDLGRTSALDLKRQVEYIYGKGTVYPIVIGIETDSDALIFHNGGEHVLDLRMCAGFSEAALRRELERLYPEMSERVLNDLLPFAVGNLKHIEDVKGRTPIEMGHLEQVICVGRGYGWLHLPNVAFIIGPFSEDWPAEIAAAGGMIRKNMDEWKRTGRKPEHEGVAVLCSSAYFERNIESLRAETRARYFARVATEVLRAHVPGLRFKLIIAATDMQTQLLDMFDQSEF